MTDTVCKRYLVLDAAKSFWRIFTLAADFIHTGGEQDRSMCIMRAKVIKRSCPVDLEPRHQRIVAGEHLNRWRFSPVKHHDVIVPRFAVRDDDAAIRGFDGFQAGREYVKTCKVNIALSASILEGFHLGSYLWFDERDFVVAPSPRLGLKGSFHVRRNRQGKITACAALYAQEAFSANVRQFDLHKLPNFRVGIGVDGCC